MIFTRTPFRIAFFGAETNDPTIASESGGKVLSATIDKYSKILLKKLPSFLDYKYRIAYSKIELVKSVSDIKHAVVREIMKYLNLDSQDLGYEIEHSGDLPLRSGLGSSSALAVGLFNALISDQDHKPSKKELADFAIELQQNILKKGIKAQDQTAVAYGGLNKINFKPNGTYTVNPVKISFDRLNSLNSHLVLFYSGSKPSNLNTSKNAVEKSISERDKLEFTDPVLEKALSVLTNRDAI